MHSFSKDPKQVFQDATNKGYGRVRFQQGKPLLDRELNLLGDLAHPSRLAEPYIGSGVPTDNNGFAITNLNVATNEFTIGAGRCLVSGNEVALAANTTYQTQPNKGKVANFPGQPFGVYLHVFPTEFTDVEDADLKNAGDVGFVTALREKSDWEVVTSVAALTTDHYQLATIDPLAKTITDNRRRDLTVASVRDEINAARGTTAAVNVRLNASLNADGTIKDNTVGNPQLANGSVNDIKLAANAVTEPRVANNAVSKRTIQDGAVPISKMSNVLVLNTQSAVPAAPGAGQLGTFVQNIQTIDEDAFYLISVRQIAPRPTTEPAQSHNITWIHRVMVAKPFGANLPNQHTHQIVIQNPNLFPVTVACKAFRLSET